MGLAAEAPAGYRVSRMIALDRTIALPWGAGMPALGLGTWRMGERRALRSREVAALALGLELGVSMIDTAEMYGDGAAEEIVGEAIAGRRERVFIVSKVYPHNATRRGTIAACKRSLKRLRSDYLDLYLLHWRGDVPLAETIAGMQALRSEGAIRAWGVSNFGRADLEELLALPGGEACAANQVLYHLGERGIEWDLLPLCRRRRIAVMAYSPLDQGRLLASQALKTIAQRLEATPAQVAIAWLLAQQGAAVIPKAANATHVHDNVSAAKLHLDDAALAALARAFPPPARATSLRML